LPASALAAVSADGVAAVGSAPRLSSGAPAAHNPNNMILSNRILTQCPGAKARPAFGTNPTFRRKRANSASMPARFQADFDKGTFRPATCVSCLHHRARRNLDSSGARPFGVRNAVVAPKRLRSNTLAVPESRQSCKEVAGKLQACCKLPLSLSRPVPRQNTGAVQPAGSVASRRARLQSIDCGRAAKVTRIGRISTWQAPLPPTLPDHAMAVPHTSWTSSIIRTF